MIANALNPDLLPIQKETIMGRDFQRSESHLRVILINLFAFNMEGCAYQIAIGVFDTP